MPENTEQRPLVPHDSLQQQLASYHERQRSRQRQRDCSEVIGRTVVSVVALSFLTLLLLGLCWPGQPRDRAGELHHLLRVYQHSKHFSGVLRVSLNGHNELAHAMGLANVPFTQVMTPTSVFRMGTHVHVLLAIAMLQLQEKNLVDVHSSVSDHWTLDEWRAFGLTNKHGTTWCPTLETSVECQVVTFAHLLSMGSGIRTQRTRSMQAFASLGEQIGTFLKDSLAFRPGTSYSYADENTVLLAYMVEKLSGVRIKEYFEQYIFRPLGLNQTTYDPFAEAVHVREDMVDEYVQFYVDRERSNGTESARESSRINGSVSESDRLVERDVEHMGTGSCSIYKGFENSIYGLQSTSEDMHKLYTDLFHAHGRHSKILQPNSLAQMVQTRNVANPAFGLGIRVEFGAPRGKHETSWPEQIAFCGTTTCSTSCMAMQMLPSNRSILSSVFTNEIHLDFPSLDAFHAYEPTQFLRTRINTSEKVLFEREDGAANTLAWRLVHIFLRFYTASNE
ncbi:hypothetical protein PsorP6_007285 [Peronosclerospora sorghi]|uniref:Uncharacterized protein n=1 Tax=Peronosclerospora sorghi TaxID=230839 RepID=A0ACC0WC47_9STRA|nr:hypothetical protein PsorP6_007285 [Peronosclerospora sorghi]